MAKTRRGRGGRFVKAPARRRTYRTTRRRSNPRRSTRAGGVRKTARRAYQTRGGKPLYRRRKSNPTMFTPATRYALWASGGAIGAAIADRQRIPGVTELANMIPGAWVSNSTVIGVAAIAVAQFMLKGDNKRNITAAGVGMLVPTAGKAIVNMLPAPGGAHGYVQGHSQTHLPAPKRYGSCPTNYSNPYLAASSGLNVA
jgi:hypothetical protein